MKIYKKQLTGIELERLNKSLSGQRIVVDHFNQVSLAGGSLVFDMQKNEIYTDTNLTVYTPQRIPILQELPLFDGDINWLMVMCESWEPDFKYTSWCDAEWEIEKDLQHVNFKGMYETDSIPDNKWQARFFGEPIKDVDEYSREGHELCFQ